jgi:hypothetical protein
MSPGLSERSTEFKEENAKTQFKIQGSGAVDSVREKTPNASYTCGRAFIASQLWGQADSSKAVWRYQGIAALRPAPEGAGLRSQ